MIEQKIYYKKVRDFGQVFGAAFGFIKQNFKSLYGSLLFVAGPFLLIAAVISSISFGTNMGMSEVIREKGLYGFYETILTTYVIVILISLIGLSVYSAILNRNVILNETLMPEEKLSIAQVTRNMWTDVTRVLLNILLLILVTLVAFAVIALIMTGLFSLLADGSSGGTGTALMIVIWLLLFFVASLIFVPILSYVVVASIFVCQRDKIGIFPAMGKVFRYMRGNFWMTWVVSIVALITYMIMGAIVQIPVFVLTLISTFSRVRSLDSMAMDTSTPVYLVVVTAICSLLGYGVAVVYHLMAIYQFTSLEEKKEGVSIIEKINKIQ